MCFTVIASGYASTKKAPLLEKENKNTSRKKYYILVSSLLSDFHMGFHYLGAHAKLDSAVQNTIATGQCPKKTKQNLFKILHNASFTMRNNLVIVKVVRLFLFEYLGRNYYRPELLDWMIQ